MSDNRRTTHDCSLFLHENILDDILISFVSESHEVSQKYSGSPFLMPSLQCIERDTYVNVHIYSMLHIIGFDYLH